MSGKRRGQHIQSEAVRAVVGVYDKVMRRSRVRFRRGPDSPEDLVHDTYLRVLEKPPSRVDKPLAYMSSAVSHGAVSSARKPDRVVFDSEEMDQTLETGQEICIRDIADEIVAERQLMEYVMRLPSHLAAALVLCKRDGFSYEEAGDELGVSGETIKKYLAQAIKLCCEMERMAGNRGTLK